MLSIPHLKKFQQWHYLTPDWLAHSVSVSGRMMDQGPNMHNGQNSVAQWQMKLKAIFKVIHRQNRHTLRLPAFLKQCWNIV